MKSWTTLAKSNLVHLRAKKISKGYSLVLDINFKNKRIFEYLKIYLSTVDKKKFSIEDKNVFRLAEVIMAKRITELNTGTYTDTAEFNKDDLINHYFERIVKQKKRDKSKSYYKWQASFNMFDLCFKEGISFSEIKPKHMEIFKNYLLKELKKNNSAHSYLSIVSSMFNLAVRDELIESNPVNRINRIKWLDTELKYLTLDEVGILHNSKTDHPIIKNAFLFSCFTGLRISDIEQLTWNKIQKEGKNFVIRLSQIKTQEPVTIYLAEQALIYLPERGDPAVRVFNLLNRRHTQRNLKLWFDSIENFTKTGVTFHSARHTFATLTLTYGADLKTVSELLGHSSIRVTEKYAKVINKLKIDAVKNLPTLDH